MIVCWMESTGCPQRQLACKSVSGEEANKANDQARVMARFLEKGVAASCVGEFGSVHLR